MYCNTDRPRDAKVSLYFVGQIYRHWVSRCTAANLRERSSARPDLAKLDHCLECRWQKVSEEKDVVDLLFTAVLV